MKKNICLSVDIEIYLLAKTKTDNISATVNNFLESLAYSEPLNEVIERKTLQEEIFIIQNSIKDLNIQLNLKNINLKNLDNLERNKLKEINCKEEYKRWICPICSHKNLMYNLRCEGKCQLNIRDDSKTTFIYLDEKIEVV